jgi:hypothetical protein
MATVLDEYNIQDQRCVVRFSWAKRLNANNIHKKCFLFSVGSVCRVKRLITGSRNVANVSLMTKRFKRACGSG